MGTLMIGFNKELLYKKLSESKLPHPPEEELDDIFNWNVEISVNKAKDIFSEDELNKLVSIFLQYSLKTYSEWK